MARIKSIIKETKDIQENYQQSPIGVIGGIQNLDKKPNKVSKNKLIIVLVSAIIILGALVGYFGKQIYNLKYTSDSNKVAADETAKIIAEVSKLIVLPVDEQPTIATVTDLERLKDQPFFVNARVGDKVLIYVSAKKAILYNPKENKIIEVAPINTTPNNKATSTKI